MKRVTFSVDFLFKASPAIVYNFLTSPDCLARWFCDDCNLIDDFYYFEWEGNEEAAQVIDDIEEEYVRLVWEGYENEQLEFKLSQSEVTGETILEIKGYCDKGEEAEEIEFWEAQIESLKRAMGT